METFYIYKIYNEYIPNIYIGSTKNLNRRIIDHKKDCYNKNIPKYNNRLYSFIRDNGGIDNWKFQLIDTIQCYNNEIKEKEQYYIKNLNADLNTYKAYRTTNEIKELNNNKNNKYYNNNKYIINEKKKEKIQCYCGGKYTLGNKSTHFKQKMHKEWEILYWGTT